MIIRGDSQTNFDADDDGDGIRYRRPSSRGHSDPKGTLPPSLANYLTRVVAPKHPSESKDLSIARITATESEAGFADEGALMIRVHDVIQHHLTPNIAHFYMGTHSATDDRIKTTMVNLSAAQSTRTTLYVRSLESQTEMTKKEEAAGNV
ncbi:unnamed protein product [Angiostrongylus costaricensis]|uniref:Uncharacterized protein n=1 Tax=Angiostrongylus costaricensis TaxID=334426 RepID=A0A0R3PG87_ANGCS|nr:unnamed protein product [Angiostrongylus costaricensis]